MRPRSTVDNAAPAAPGAPGSKPTWSPAAKSGVGCALAPSSCLWFTISRGIITEVYHPWVDQAAIRDVELIVTGPQGFFSGEKCDCASSVQPLALGVPAYQVENRCIHGRYRISKQIIVDPARDVLLQQIKITASSGTLSDLRLFVLLSPRLGDQGEDNSGWLGDYRNWKMVFAQREAHSLALASSAPWRARSVGFVGTSDAWQDLRRHGHITQQYSRADHGHIALAGEVDLQACEGEFVLAMALDRSTEAAAVNAIMSLNGSFAAIRDAYVQAWQGWQKSLAPLDSGETSLLVNDNAEQRNRPDHSRPRIDEQQTTTRPANLYRASAMVLRVHRSKQFAGAGVASLALPWGEVRGDDDLGGYHLVWPRDLVEEAFGFLAMGAADEVRYALGYLRATQKTSGGWPQNMWLEGRAYSDGVQLDEAALPILLVDLASREGALSQQDVRSLWPMVRSAAAFVIRSGPSTGQDRWEDTPGLSPYTLATEIAALVIAARLAQQFGEPQIGEYFLETADLWNDLIEPWTYVTHTPLARRVGVEGYYVRIAPSPGMHTILRRGASPLMQQAHDLPVTEVVSPDALALVRFGLRAADDPRMINTVRVIDAMTRVDLPAGPCWRRYNGDYYGEHHDGAPLSGHGDKSGHGRAWPLLTGERGHFELARANSDEAKRMLQAMNGFASQSGLLPEQVWDSDDLPTRNLSRGRPSGSAMPLAWTHSEYIRLLRSIRDQQIFDQPTSVYERYVKRAARSDLALWRFDHPVDSFSAGRRLRIEVLAPAVVHFSTDDWHTAGDIETRDTGLGFHVADLPTEQMWIGHQLHFTFRWPASGNRWEGRDFQLTIEPSLAAPARQGPTDRTADSRHGTPLEIHR